MLIRVADKRIKNKILRGAKPGEFPVGRPTRLEFAVNLKTAKGLGATIPRAILLRADRVIQCRAGILE